MAPGSTGGAPGRPNIRGGGSGPSTPALCLCLAVGMACKRAEYECDLPAERSVGESSLSLSIFAASVSNHLHLKMNNALGQNPCLVVAWLAYPCFGGTSENALYIYLSIAHHSLDNEVWTEPPNSYYSGPANGTATLCLCNTVYYSLLSACAICQIDVAINP